jgi:PST family polysaccharide transporter
MTGMLIGSVGMLLLTRTMDQERTGCMQRPLGILLIFSAILDMLGIGVYLIRHEGEVTLEDYHQAFSLLLILGISIGSLGLWFALDF